jgi:lysyl endopeptidase
MKKYFRLSGFLVVSVLVLMLMVIQNTQINAQVLTRVLGSKETMDMYLPFPFEEEPIMYQQPKLDFERILKEDERAKRQIPRFAVDYEMSYGVKDGIWTDYENFSVWKIGFNASSASSMQIMLENVELPKEAEMYIFSTESKMIQGPITMEAVSKGFFTSDVIERSGKVQIAVICKAYNKNLLLNITKIGQGIVKNGARAWEDAGDCNFDVNCPIGAAWQLQRDAVGMIVVDMNGNCSGSLINNTCQDLTPNFLTAFHCLESGLGTNMSNWVFRFNYQSINPTCPGNTSGPESNSTTWITRNGAILTTGHSDSDFALLLLNGGLIGSNAIEANLALAGWDRTTVASTGGVGIHHPEGDAKKISLYTTAPFSSFREGGASSSGKFWQLTFASGVTEPGSSGSPLFNQIGRINGQAFGTTHSNFLKCTNPTGDAIYGKFDVSWGLGLNGFLGGVTPPLTLNGIRVPSINNNNSNVVCTTNKQFSLLNPIPGKVVTWTVSNVGLFATSGGASISGIGTVATLRAASSTSKGSAILTYTLTQAGCQNLTFTINIWVGKPLNPTTTPSGSPAISIGISQNKTILLNGSSNTTGAEPFVGTWTASGSVSTSSSPPTPAKAYTGNNSGSGNFSVFTSNTCGNSLVKWGAFNVSGGCSPCPRIIINNPVSQLIHCEVPLENLHLEDRLNVEKIVGKFNILDNNGNIMINENFNTNKHSSDVSRLNPGIYFARMEFKNVHFIEKVIVIR